MIPNYHRLESILSKISFLHHSHKGHCPATVLANDRRTSIVIMYANAIAECNGRCNGLNIIPLMTGALDTTHPEHPASLIKCSSPILVIIAIIIIWCGNFVKVSVQSHKLGDICVVNIYPTLTLRLNLSQLYQRKYSHS